MWITKRKLEQLVRREAGSLLEAKLGTVKVEEGATVIVALEPSTPPNQVDAIEKMLELAYPDAAQRIVFVGASMVVVPPLARAQPPARVSPSPHPCLPRRRGIGWPGEPR